ncbi:ribosomal protein L7/L12 [Clostridium sp. DL1XJH146]
MELTIIAFLLIIISLLITTVSSLKNEITKMNLTINKIAKEVGVTNPSIDFDNVNIEVLELIREGKKIKAIKKYRELTGIGLKEAKEYIDNLSENQINL